MKTDTRTGLVAAGALTLAVFAAGCGGGSSTQATPLGSSPSTSISHPTSTSARPRIRPGTGPGAAAAAATTASKSKSSTPTTPTTEPTGQLSAVTQDLDQAGASLAASDSAINGSDVNQAKAQEGSAP
jgi:hypothetical protein